MVIRNRHPADDDSRCELYKTAYQAAPDIPASMANRGIEPGGNLL